MRKMDLVAAICEQSGLSRFVVKSVVDALFEQIRQNARAGEMIAIPGFGRFQEVEGKDGLPRLRFFPALKTRQGVKAADEASDSAA